LDSVTYQRLPGRGFGPFRRDRIWLADDHLLSIRSSRFVDIYERFYFSDIQGIYFRDRRGEFLMILAAHLVPCVSLAALGGIFHWAWLIPMVPLAAWTLAYALLGSQAECRVQTMLGLHKVPAIGRRAVYEQLLERIGPLIEAAQGPLEPASFEVIAPVESKMTPPPMEGLRQPKAPYRGWFFESAFASVILAGLFSLWNQRASRGAALDWAEYALSFSGMVLILIGLVRAYRIDVGGAVMACLWSILGTQAIYSISTGIVASIQSAIPRVPNAVRTVDHHPIRSLPSLVPYATAMEGLCIVLALVGLLLILNRKRQQIA